MIALTEKDSSITQLKENYKKLHQATTFHTFFGSRNNNKQLIIWSNKKTLKLNDKILAAKLKSEMFLVSMRYVSIEHVIPFIFTY